VSRIVNHKHWTTKDLKRGWWKCVNIAMENA
jgi:hypothetical protein